jgi:putative transposase
VLAEQTDEWAEQRRYMGVEILAKARQAAVPTASPEVVPSTAISA